VRRSKQRTANNIIIMRFGAQRMAKNTAPNFLNASWKIKNLILIFAVRRPLKRTAKASYCRVLTSQAHDKDNGPT
jgi:hypothetical protein